MATELIERIFTNLSSLDLLLIGANFLLLLFSKTIVKRLSHDNNDATGNKLHFFRVANLLLLLLILFSNLLLPYADRSWISQLLSVLVVGYLAYLSFHLLNYLIQKRFGREREVDGKTVITETYNARILSLLAAVFTFILVLVSSIRILGFDSLLEAGGVIGLVGVFLALTQSSWAPDIISGLVILNSRMIEEGDVIQLNEGSEITVGVVYKTKVFHTELLNLVNNHRIMFKNARLRELTIHNLSKFASAKGLRERLTFKIGYEETEERVRTMFEQAVQNAVEKEGIPIEAQYPVEVRAIDAGDFAIEWSLFYYTKSVRDLLRTRQLLLSAILKESAARKISLATPMLQQIVHYKQDNPSQ